MPFSLLFRLRGLRRRLELEAASVAEASPVADSRRNEQGRREYTGSQSGRTRRRTYYQRGAALLGNSKAKEFPLAAALFCAS